MMWADFSAKLVTAGVITGYFAALAGLIDFLSNRLIRAQRGGRQMRIGALALSRAIKRLGLALVCISALALAACSDSSFDPQTQLGPNPNLPEPKQYLFPPMRLASVVGWRTALQSGRSTGPAVAGASSQAACAIQTA
jgi:hypothetical protein